MAPTPSPAAWTGPEPATGNYFVATYPPFSCWSPVDTTPFRRSLERRAVAPHADLGLYVHIPFCVERCSYCYYLTHDNRFGDVSSYVEALVGEVQAYRSLPAIADRSIGFVYFGGGTPSVLPLARLRTLVDALRRVAPWDAAREVTFECAPRSVTADKLSFLRDAGITRLSLGVQAMDDRVLAANGRVHAVRDIEDAWELVSRAGFAIRNIDLIVGLVQETEESFFTGLDRVMALGPESVTIYQLEIPVNTRLYRSLPSIAAADRPADWDTKHARLARAFRQLESAGYHLRSAYTAVRDPQRQPFVYQDEQYRGADVLGVGVSAFSFLGGIGQQNIATLDGYLAARRRGDLPLWRGCVLTDEERLIREFVLQLKLGSVDREYFLDKFGCDVLDRFAAPLAEGLRCGWFGIGPRGVTVTLEGLVRIDRLLPAFYQQNHQGIRYS
jgi:oxygen-independent coproporphyrinogen-3 oxidase